MRRVALSTAVGLAAAVAMGASRDPSAAAPSASRTLDRTFVCAPSLVGGQRQIGVRGRAGSGRSGSRWERPALAAISTTVSGAAATAIEDELVWVTAGAPSATATVISTFAGFTFPMRTWGTIGVNAKRCRATTARVPLERSGLDGGATGPIDERYDCSTPRRVLVHVRALLRSGSSLSGYRGFLRTTVPVEQASLAVRTQSGTRVAYAEVAKSGKALLYHAPIPSCTPD